MSRWDDLEIGVYYNRGSAEEAVTRLCALGYDLPDVSVLMSEKTRIEEFSDVTSGKTAKADSRLRSFEEPLTTLTASLTKAIAKDGRSEFPLATGPLTALFSTVGAGGVSEALMCVGVTETQAKKYEEALKNGGILISVRSRNSDHERVKRILFTPLTSLVEFGTSLGFMDAERRNMYR